MNHLPSETPRTNVRCLSSLAFWTPENTTLRSPSFSFFPFGAASLETHGSNEVSVFPPGGAAAGGKNANEHELGYGEDAAAERCAHRLHGTLPPRGRGGSGDSEGAEDEALRLQHQLSPCLGSQDEVIVDVVDGVPR